MKEHIWNNGLNFVKATVTAPNKGSIIMYTYDRTSRAEFTSWYQYDFNMLAFLIKQLYS